MPGSATTVRSSACNPTCGWVAANAGELGGRNGPPVAGQLLVCPVTDCTFTRPSYDDNATGYFLTRSSVHWFWDLYCSPAERSDPRASPQ